MFDVKVERKQDNNGLTVKHTLLIDGKRIDKCVSVFSGKHSVQRLLDNLDVADANADTQFAPIIKAQLDLIQRTRIDAAKAVDDVQDIKLTRSGKNFRLTLKSNFASFNRVITIREPAYLVSGAGALITLVTEGRDLIEAIVYKMALNQRLNEIFRDRLFGFRTVINEL